MAEGDSARESLSLFSMQDWGPTSRSLPTIRPCLGPLDQWPRPLPHLSSASMSSHHPITTTPTVLVCRPIILHFGSKEGGDSGVLELRHLRFGFATPGWSLRTHRLHSSLAQRWLPPADRPSQAPRLSCLIKMLQKAIQGRWDHSLRRWTSG